MIRAIRSQIPQNRNNWHTLIRCFSAGETVISFKGVSFEYSHQRQILKEANFNIREGSKVTIMGQNGSGKTTILKMLNGLLKQSAGSINVKKNFALATAKQVITPEERERTLYEYFLKHCNNIQGGIDGRIAKVLQKVNLQNVTHDRLIKSFSGGQQARLLLASALILEPDVLLLDEPTNNLDKEGIEVLRDIIKNSDKTTLVISHDEDFLNSFTDAVLYIDPASKQIEYYDGDYHYVKREIKNRIDRENQENARLQREATQKKQQASVFANKGGTNMRKMAKKLRETAEELDDMQVKIRREDLALRKFEIPFQTHGVQGTHNRSVGVKMMTIASIELPQNRGIIDYKGQPIYIEKGTHIRICGPNGIGKTTFLESIVNHTAKGVNINPIAEIGYYRQDFHNLCFTETVIDTCLKASNGKHDEGLIRATAARFFFRSHLMNQLVGSLSEGQKGLLSLLCIVLTEPAILIMDEPTNHINFRHLPAIAEALNSYPGAMLIVSHDAEFVAKLKIDREIDLGVGY